MIIKITNRKQHDKKEDDINDNNNTNNDTEMMIKNIYIQ